jgi:hypothetical protein
MVKLAMGTGTTGYGSTLKTAAAPDPIKKELEAAKTKWVPIAQALEMEAAQQSSARTVAQRKLDITPQVSSTGAGSSLGNKQRLPEIPAPPTAEMMAEGEVIQNIINRGLKARTPSTAKAVGKGVLRGVSLGIADLDRNQDIFEKARYAQTPLTKGEMIGGVAGELAGSFVPYAGIAGVVGKSLRSVRGIAAFERANPFLHGAIVRNFGEELVDMSIRKGTGQEYNESNFILGMAMGGAFEGVFAGIRALKGVSPAAVRQQMETIVQEIGEDAKPQEIYKALQNKTVVGSDVTYGQLYKESRLAYFRKDEGRPGIDRPAPPPLSGRIEDMTKINSIDDLPFETQAMRFAKDKKGLAEQLVDERSQWTSKAVENHLAKFENTTGKFKEVSLPAAEQRITQGARGWKAVDLNGYRSPEDFTTKRAAMEYLQKSDKRIADELFDKKIEVRFIDSPFGDDVVDAVSGTPMVNRSTVSPLPDLLAEARRYKTADEFVKANESSLDFHASRGELQLSRKFNRSQYDDGMDLMDYVGMHVGTKKAAASRTKSDFFAGEKKVITPLIVDIKKPFGNKIWTEDELRKVLKEYGSRQGITNTKQTGIRAFQEMKKEGYDGILYKNSTENKGSVSKIVFDESQVTDVPSLWKEAQGKMDQGTLLPREIGERRMPGLEGDENFINPKPEPMDGQMNAFGELNPQGSLFNGGTVQPIAQKNTMPIASIQTDPKRFQFRDDIDKARGFQESNVKGILEQGFSDTEVRPIEIGRFPDAQGQMQEYVVNGHNTLEVLRRVGRTDAEVRTIDFPSEQAAIAYARKANMVSKMPEVLQRVNIAKALQGEGKSVEQIAAELGRIKTTEVQTLLNIADASPSIQRQVSQGVLKTDMAGIIGKYAKMLNMDDGVQEQMAMKVLEDRFTPARLESYLNALGAMASKGKQEMTLFGIEDIPIGFDAIETKLTAKRSELASMQKKYKGAIGLGEAEIGKSKLARFQKAQNELKDQVAALDYLLATGGKGEALVKAPKTINKKALRAVQEELFGKVPERPKAAVTEKAVPRDLDQRSRPAGPLTPEQKRIEEDAYKYLEENKEQIFAKYDAPQVENPRAVFMAGGTGVGKTASLRGVNIKDYVYVSSDALKEDFLPVMKGEMDLWNFMNQHAPSVHEPSSDAAKELFARRINEGKNVLYDSNLTSMTAPERIQMALDNNMPVEIKYVHRDPTDAWKGVVSRTDRTGRLLKQEEHIKRHIEAPQKFLEIYEQFKDSPDVKFSVLDNSGTKGAAKEVDIDFVRNLRYNADDVRQAIQQTATTNDPVTRYSGGSKQVAQQAPPRSGEGGALSESMGEPSRQPEAIKLASKPVKTPEEVDELIFNPTLRGYFTDNARKALDANYIRKFGEEGQQIGRMIDKADEIAGIRIGIDVDTVSPILRKMTPEEIKRFPDIAEGKIQAVTENEKELMAFWAGRRAHIANSAKAHGLTVKGSDGIERPFIPRDNYYPRHIKEDVLKEILKNPERQNALFVSMMEKSNGQIGSVTEAKRIFNNFVKDRLQKRFGNLERAREMEWLPDELLERDPRKVMVQYLEGSYRRLADAAQFGAKQEKIMAQIEKARVKGMDADTMMALVRRATGEEDFNAGIVQASRALRTYQNISKLSLAAVTNMGDIVKPFVRTGQFFTTLKGILKSFTEEGASQGRRSGAVEANLRALLQDAGETKLSDAFFKYTGFTFTETKIRQFNANAAIAYADTLIKRLGKNPDNMFAMRRLTQLLDDPEGAIKRGFLTQAEKDIVGFRGIADTQPLRRLDLPYYWQSPGVKVLTQFKSFAYKHMLFMKKFVIDEAKQGNVRPLVAFLVMGQVVGEGVGDMKAWIRGRERDDDLTRRMIDNYMTIGGIGLTTDFLSNLQYGSLGGGFLKFVAGPTLSDVDDWFTRIASTNRVERVAKKGLYSIPVVGPAAANAAFPTTKTYRARTIPIAEDIIQLMQGDSTEGTARSTSRAPVRRAPVRAPVRRAPVRSPVRR